MVPWNSGRPLVWDATCPDTFATSYRVQAIRDAGCIATSAEEKKSEKLSQLSPSYIFTPVAIQTSGAIGHNSKAFLRESWGRWVRLQSGKAKLPPPEVY